jgi:hypothetical protein
MFVIKKRLIKSASHYYLYFKTIAFAVSLDNPCLTLFCPSLAYPMFHTDGTIIFFVVEVFEDILIVYLTCGGFIPSRVITAMKSGDLTPGRLNIGYQITFLNLLMIDVFHDFAGRSVHCPAYGICLRDPMKEQSRMVNIMIQGFQDKCHTGRFHDITTIP